ncbi:MAG: putative outer arm dynein light chain 4 [Streblomastix strix]|uniref:Dynein axonemal light chain 4 n=1 Tax=Streblomastix strix TaxID=222440 RepID=A0A5J4WGM0_9EUKA|nr:MAG: putative outer arm dynein light chain 4 [Streblomastix strix]
MEDEEKVVEKVEEEAQDSSEEIRKIMNYPLVKFCDMNEEMKGETIEVVVTALEKSPNNLENAAKLMKDAMDKKFGGGWIAVAGQGFGFSLSSHVKNLLFLYYGGSIAVLIYKAS